MFPNLTFDLDIFNLTMTYRLDSDIRFPYGEVVDKVTRVVVAPNYEVDWRSFNGSLKGLTFSQNLNKT